VKEAITQLGLEYRLMTQFTSFVAVEDRVVTKDGKPQRVEVPVEMPEGVSYEGVFGNKQFDRLQSFTKSGRSYQRWLNQDVGYIGGVAQSGPVKATRVNAPTIAVPPPPPPPPVMATMQPEVQPVSPSQKPKLSAERQLLESKLQPALLEAFDCAAKKVNDCKLVHDGNVRIMIWLAKDTPAVRDALAKAGFHLDSGATKGSLAGTISAEKLLKLAQITELKFASFVRN